MADFIAKRHKEARRSPNDALKRGEREHFGERWKKEGEDHRPLLVLCGVKTAVS